MKTVRHFLASLLLVSLFTTICVAQNITWYKFDRDFINAKYSDRAIGNLAFTESHPAGTESGPLFSGPVAHCMLD